jgi:hypothetical protein
MDLAARGIEELAFAQAAAGAARDLAAEGVAEAVVGGMELGAAAVMAGGAEAAANEPEEQD